ncbi:hypothetical protein EV2_034926 [Malus domestica]
MGHNKLQRTENCVMLRACTESSTLDRFSNLPIEVAHHILSFLFFKDLTRASAVSKRCRQLYLSNPTVSFDAISIPSCNWRRGELYNSLDTELIDDHYRVITWIHNAIRCKVEELDLDFTVFGMTIFAFLSCILLCPSLRSLSLNLRGTTLQVPSLYFSCNLRQLTLRDVTFVDGRFCTWLSSSCRSIKELQLIQVKGMQNISIESSSLESLKLVSGNNGDLFHLNISGEKLEEIHIAWKNVSSSPSSTSLMISAPNLKKLKLEGHLTNRLKFWKHTTLEKAEILLWSKANECGNIFEVLRSVCNAKTVILNDQATKALFGKGSVTEPLHDICNLGLHLRSLNDDIVPAVVSLFRAVTSMNTLHISVVYSQVVVNVKDEDAKS